MDNGGIELNIDLNQIEAMQTTELEALYGELSTQEFTVKTALSVVSLELETRIKTRKSTPIGVEETTTSGDTRLELFRTGHFETGSHFAPTVEDAPAPEGCDCVFCVDTEVEDIPVDSPVHCGEECDTCDEEAAERVARKTRSDAGVPRGPHTAPRALDHSSCCGEEGRRMNTATLDCAACREVVE